MRPELKVRLFRNCDANCDEKKSQIRSAKFNHPFPSALGICSWLCASVRPVCTTVCLCLRCSSPALCVDGACVCAYSSVFDRKLGQKVLCRRKQAFSNNCRERARQDGVKASRVFAWHAACISWPILSCRIKSQTTSIRSSTCNPGQQLSPTSCREVQSPGKFSNQTAQRDKPASISLAVTQPLQA